MMDVIRATKAKTSTGTTFRLLRLFAEKNSRSTETRMTNQNSAPEFSGYETSDGFRNFIKVDSASDCKAAAGPSKAQAHKAIVVTKTTVWDDIKATRPVATESASIQRMLEIVAQLSPGVIDGCMPFTA